MPDAATSPSTFSVPTAPRTLVLNTGHVLYEEDGEFVVLDGMAYITVAGMLWVDRDNPDIAQAQRKMLLYQLGPYRAK